MFFDSFNAPRKDPSFNHRSKYTAHLLLIVILIFVGSIVTAFDNDEENITKVETRKLVNTEPEPITIAEVETNAEDLYFDVPLDRDIQKYIFTMCSECDSCELDPAIVTAIIWRESEFNVDAVGDSGNSLGLMQVQPRWHSERMEKLSAPDLLNPYQNIRVGIDYLVDLYSINENTEWVLMAYNGGPTYANELRSKGLVSEYAIDVLKKANELREASRI